ncbi:hypothetical protein GCM10027021_21050 [Dyella kyungheensis]|jgi:hypothetical protein
MLLAQMFLDAQFLQQIRIRHTLSLPVTAGSVMRYTLLERARRLQKPSSAKRGDSCHLADIDRGQRTGPVVLACRLLKKLT